MNGSHGILRECCFAVDGVSPFDLMLLDRSEVSFGSLKSLKFVILLH